ncbi:MAG: hypothetical protein QOH64_848 [Acidimicrobiaceae bacterium]
MSKGQLVPEAASDASAAVHGAGQHPQPRSVRGLVERAVVSLRSGDPLRRRPGDLGVLVGSGVSLLLIALRARPRTGPEVDLALFLNGLLHGVADAVSALSRFGSLWVVGVIAGVGALVRRRSLSVELFIAGGAAWALGRAQALWYGQHPPPPKIVVHGGGLQEFPLVRIAVAVAVVSTAAPYLTRLARRVAWALITLMGAAAVSLGVGLPSDVVAGVLVGWACAAAVHLVFGSPGGRPSLEEIAGAMEEIGAEASGLHFAPAQEAGSTQVLASAPDGADVHIRAYGRDEQQAQLLSKLWRFVWYEDSGPTLHVTRLQQVEHEAYATLLGAQAGAAVPEVIAAATAGRATAVLVERRPPGTPASELDVSRLSDELLDAAWHAVVALRRARVAHGALDLSKLYVTDDGRVLVIDFGLASTSVSDTQLAADAARLLAATCATVGPERAFAAARRALGDLGFIEVIPYLQAPVLTDAVRHSFRHRRGALAELRATAAATVGADPPPLVQLERVRPRSVALAVLTFVGMYTLLAQLGSFSQLTSHFRHASWGWILIAALLAAATNVGYAIAYAGATTARLPFGRTVELQAAGSFTNLIAPNGLATAAINARFLQLRGVPTPAALASLFVNTAGAAIAELGLLVAVLPFASSHFDLSLIPWNGVIVGGVAVGSLVAVAAAVVWRLPRARRFVGERARPALHHLRGVFHSPAKLSMVVGGQALVQILYAAALGAACLAFGASVPFATLVLVNVGSSALSGLIPISGGLGVAEATLAGALTATGVPSPAAISITLAYRLVTTWLPWAPGWFALRALQRDDDL